MRTHIQKSFIGGFTSVRLRGSEAWESTVRACARGLDPGTNDCAREVPMRTMISPSAFGGIFVKL